MRSSLMLSIGFKQSACKKVDELNDLFTEDIYNNG